MHLSDAPFPDPPLAGRQAQGSGNALQVPIHNPAQQWWLWAQTLSLLPALWPS